VIYSNSFLTYSDFMDNFIREKYTSLGDFDTCLSVQKGQKPDNGAIDAQYCLLTFKSPSQFNKSELLSDSGAKAGGTSLFFRKALKRWIQFSNRLSTVQGICVPAKCSTKQLDLLMSKGS